MTREKDTAKTTTPAQAREARLKAALKQNMARRKGQAKARARPATDLPKAEEAKKTPEAEK